MPDKYPPIFIDRNSGGRTFRDFLTSAGLKVVLHDELYPQDTDDEAWLEKGSGLGYIFVTGDKAITRQMLFLHRLAASRAYVFILYGLNGSSPQGKAGCILSALDRMVELMKLSEPPVLWKIGKNNHQAHKCDHLEILGRKHPKHRT